ncbi:hypothetical protein GNI_132760, partial [Gregarina niphandrodes]
MEKLVNEILWGSDEGVSDEGGDDAPESAGAREWEASANVTGVARVGAMPGPVEVVEAQGYVEAQNVRIDWSKVLHEGAEFAKDTMDLLPLLSNPLSVGEVHWQKLFEDGEAFGKDAFRSMEAILGERSGDPEIGQQAWLQAALRVVHQVVAATANDNLCSWYKEPPSCVREFSTRCLRDVASTWSGRRSDLYWSEALGTGYLELPNNPVKALRAIIQLYCLPFVDAIHPDAILAQHTTLAHHIPPNAAPGGIKPIVRPVSVSDPLGSSQWYLGELQVNQAWRVIAEAPLPPTPVLVADTGLDTEHEDLRHNLWINEEEKDGTALLDDD